MADGGGLSIRIRRARASDLPELTRIAHAAKRHWNYSDELITIWRDDLTITSDELQDDLVFCAERDGTVAGFYSVSGDGPSRKIEHMWVLPEHMGSGIGRALFDHMTGELRGAGVEHLRIESDPNAVGFYERLGARRIGDVTSTPAGRTLPLLELTIER